jgi:hypothetical protein
MTSGSSILEDFMEKINITIPEALEKIKEKQEHAMTVCTSPPLTHV